MNEQRILPPSVEFIHSKNGRPLLRVCVHGVCVCSLVTFIYIALLTIQIVSKHLTNCIKLEDRVSVMYNNEIKL